MKIAIVGLGAIGGLMAARLARTGHRVVGLARGATLAAVQSNGLRWRSNGIDDSVPLQVSDDAATLGPQDLVVVALKGPALLQGVASLLPLIGDHTVVMPAMNGVPWWFLQTLPDGAVPARRDLTSVDPQGVVDAALPFAQVLGCVVHLSAASQEPGVIAHTGGDRLIVGEPRGGLSARATGVCEALAEAGFQAEASDDIRREIWFKLWGNMTMNPVSALTGATADLILDDPLVRGFILRAMAEAAAIGALIGCPIAQSGEERVAITRRLGAMKTSMLQDLLAGRALELDALVAAVHEIGERLNVATPNIAALLGLTRLMGRQRGLYPPAT